MDSQEAPHVYPILAAYAVEITDISCNKHTVVCMSGCGSKHPNPQARWEPDGTHGRLERPKDTGSDPQGRAAPDLRAWLRGDEPARPRGRGRDPGGFAVQSYQQQAAAAVRPGAGPRQRAAWPAR